MPIDKVETLAQMARLAPELERRLRKGDVRPRELCEVAAALARSKFFDGGLVESLAKEFCHVFKKRQLGASDVVSALCSLAELNAYNARMFEAGCELLCESNVADASKQRLEAALKQVNHDPGELLQKLRSRGSARGDTREPCTLFWRGQCKWGPKCKLSHDAESFERNAEEGKWRPPTQSGNKSVGFKQSADLFKADRCGALW